MYKSRWGKSTAIILGAALMMSAAVPTGFFRIGSLQQPYNVEAAEVTPGVDLPYEAVTAGDVLNYNLTGYADSDITFSRWISGGTVVAQGTGKISYTVKSTDEEKFISFQVNTSDGKTYTDKVYYSELPVMYIDSDRNYESFEYKTEEYAETTMNLVSTDYETEQLYSDEAGIRLRGNSTAGLEKKPFKLKLDTKSDLLGMGKNKHWVLQANAIDTTNMRNKLLLDFSGDIGAPTYMQSQNVAMIYNGEYMGVYQLCEQVRIGDERVEIYNWEDAAEEVADVFLKELQAEGLITKTVRKEISSNVEDELKADYGWLSHTHEFFSPTLIELNIGFDWDSSIDLSDYMDFDALDIPAATGGALVEMDFYEGDGASLLTAYKQPYYFDTPEAGSTFTELQDYMNNYIQTVEYALHDTDFIYDNTDAHYVNTGVGNYDWRQGKRINVQYERTYGFISEFTGMHYSQLLDMDSAVTNFLVCEFSRNWDSMKNSAFMYKDIDGKLIMGPAWDFDWAWGNSMYEINTNFPTGWQTTDDYFANEQYYQTVQWNRELIRDPYFIERVYEKYQEIRGTVIEDMIKDGGLLDTYYAEYKNASYANDAKWGGTMGSGAGAGYDTQFNAMKTFIQTRVAWLDAQFASVDTLRTSLGYYVTSSRISVDAMDVSSKEGCAVITASTTESTAKKISFQINGTYMVTADVVNGKTTVEVPDSALTSKISEANVVQIRAMDTNGNYIKKNEGTINGEYTNTISDYGVFQKERCEVIENSTLTLETVDGNVVLTNIADGTTVTDVKSNLSNTEVKVLDAKENEVAAASPVATGMTIEIYTDGKLTAKTICVVTGDVNGTGNVDVLDLEGIQKDILGLTKLSGVNLKAGQMMLGNETLSVIDMEAIQKTILGLAE